MFVRLSLHRNLFASVRINNIKLKFKLEQTTCKKLNQNATLASSVEVFCCKNKMYQKTSSLIVSTLISLMLLVTGSYSSQPSTYSQIVISSISADVLFELHSMRILLGLFLLLGLPDNLVTSSLHPTISDRNFNFFY